MNSNLLHSQPDRDNEHTGHSNLLDSWPAGDIEYTGHSNLLHSQPAGDFSSSYYACIREDSPVINNVLFTLTLLAIYQGEKSVSIHYWIDNIIDNIYITMHTT